MSSVTEAAFEAHIAGWLVEYGGYRRDKIGNVGDGPRDFDAEAGVDTADLFEFIGASQGSEWARLVDTAYGGEAGRAQSGFVQRLAAELWRRPWPANRPASSSPRFRSSRSSSTKSSRCPNATTQ